MKTSKNKLRITFRVILSISLFISLSYWFMLDIGETTIIDAEEIQSVSIIEDVIEEEQEEVSVHTFDDEIQSIVDSLGLTSFDLNYDFQNEDLDIILDQYLRERQVSDVVSIAYKNIVTNNEYEYRSDEQMFAASLYKLPLNTYVLDEAYSGNINLNNAVTLNDFHFSESPTANVCVGCSYSLYQLSTNSILYSDNVSSYALFDYVGGWATFKEATKKYSPNTIYSSNYIYENTLSSRFTNEILDYIYNHPERFELLMNNMLEVSPGVSLKQYVNVPIMQKEGWNINTRNAVGIVYAHEPYILSVFTNLDTFGEQVCAEISFLVYMHVTYYSK